jgi:hypothetical protein
MRSKPVENSLATWTGFTTSITSWPDPNEQTTLSDVLEDSVDRRYFLSPKACAGILRRASKRGRPLPDALAEALTSIAETSSSEA